jgi:hypothetical protein
MEKILAKRKKSKKFFDEADSLLRLEGMLDRRDELKEAYEEYLLLDRNIKEKTKGKNLIIGSWMVTGKWMERKGYEVKPMKYWESRIFRIGREKNIG